MNRISQLHLTWGLLVTLFLLVPMSAAGHGPDHKTTHDNQQVNQQTTKDEHQVVEPKEAEIVRSGEELKAVPKPQEPEVVNPGEWVQEKTGEFVPLEACFKNERGETVKLQQLIDRPTLLLPVYYSCPQLCSFDLANLADAVRRSSLVAGSFRVISLSFNVDDTPETAALIKPNYTQLLAKGFPESDWVFLTGDSSNIRKVTQAIGYTFKKKDETTFIHPSALAVLAKDGRIIKYVYGSFIPGDVDLALTEAAKGTPATSIRRILAFCLPANPRQSQQVFLLFRIGAVMTLLIGGLLFLRFLRKRNPSKSNSTD